MSILLDENTRVVVQGITGKEGAFHTERMIQYGTKVVAGVSPKKKGHYFLGIPVFGSVYEAVKSEGATFSCIFVSQAYVKDAIFEAIDAGIKTVVCITEGVPVHDMLILKKFAKEKDAFIIGPNTPGVISPGKAKVGVMVDYIHKKGNVGVVSRSGTLTYEVVSQLTALDIGQSTCVGIGGDPIVGMRFIDVLSLFEEDEETELVVLIGEIGGNMEEEAAHFYRSSMRKPLCAYIAGYGAPREKRMGHAGAIISGGSEDAAAKIRILEEAGIEVVRSIAEVGEKVKRLLFNLKRKSSVV
ncbi:MAG: succinate--CoA ligase subunit alpha [Deltaproteobacteria bacterium]|nr:succinate--CoA ligase subunit alpha [Deltaproteobacteria bacterium]